MHRIDGIQLQGVIGTFWFQNIDGKVMNVTSDGYLIMLRTFRTGFMRRRGHAVEKTWFQQDGATPHRT